MAVGLSQRLVFVTCAVDRASTVVPSGAHAFICNHRFG
jgi:hypothetical protein